MYNEKIPKVMSIQRSVKVDNIHDKTFKDILSNPEEMSNLLKTYIGLNVQPVDLEKYKTEFITDNYKNKISDIIYKHKEIDIFYLVEHQSTIDEIMPERILTYCVEIIRESKKGKGKSPNAVVVPIVIYTGDKKWKVSTEFSNTQIIDNKYKEFKINLKYRLIDINNYDEDELKRQETKLSIMMLLEKQKNSLDVKKILIKLLLGDINKDILQWLINITQNIILNELENEHRNELMEIIEKVKGGKDNMEEWLARVKENDKKEKEKILNKGINKGIKKGLIEIAKTMLKYNETDEKIMKYTQVSSKQLKKLKEEL